MYDLPELVSATDTWWRGLARAFAGAGVPEVPSALTRDMDMDSLWRAPDLLFAQTCGYPLTHAFEGWLRVVATPIYASPDCAGPEYRSVIVVRADDPAKGLGDLRGRAAAVNNLASQSGYNALRAAVAPLAKAGCFFGPVLTSGGHAASLKLVQGGEADVCATDCVTYELLSRYRPQALAGLRVLDRTPTAPGLPYVTRETADDDLLARLRQGVFAALADPGLDSARTTLLIAGAEVLPEPAYQRVIELERRAEALDYPRLA